MSRERPQARALGFFEDVSAHLLACMPFLEGLEHVCVAPHGPLHLLPLHALTVQGQPFITRRAAVYAPSAAVLARILARPQTAPDEDPKLVMGYYDGNTVTALWHYAQRFALNDNSFGTVFGPSTPGALNLFAGQTSGADQRDLPDLTLAGTVISEATASMDFRGVERGTGSGTALQARQKIRADTFSYI